MAYTKNYYHILGLSMPGPGSPSAQPKSPHLRRAYRNALLAAHPDKKAAVAGAGKAGRDAGHVVYTVDDVKEAYRVLDDTGRRAEYDGWILRNPQVLRASLQDGRSDGPGPGPGQTVSADFVLGLDVLDLSDFNETQGGGQEEMQWTRGCRCGDECGFRILEVDLEDAERRGEKEVLVGCGGCSLWVRVGFEVEEG